jgi:TonB family protein
MIQQRKKRNSSKVNLIISFVFHSALVLAVFYFAAREGMLGKKLKQLAVTMVKEKRPEPPKPKEEEPKPETPKPDQAPKPDAPAPVQTVTAPPRVDTAPAVAPAAATLPSFEFNDGAKEVTSINDPIAIYKALVEHTVRSQWNRPEDMTDDNFAAEVEFTIDTKGRITDSRWMSGSGDARWDNSVRTAVAKLDSIGKAPPKSFPSKFVVRFDVESTPVESSQFTAR